jgi:hypothetical protein
LGFIQQHSKLFKKRYDLIKPIFFIVGAPKCGTTAMNDYLNKHPDIFMAKKELHYFGKDLKTKIKLSESEYLRHFQMAGSKKIIGEASVWYLFSQTAADEIKRFAPGAKILIMLRNPVEVIHSLHSQHLIDGNEDVPDFEKALKLDEVRKKRMNLPHSVDFFELPPYKDSILFTNQVKRYLDVFGKENVRIILYEDFITNTEEEVLKTLTFLGIEGRHPIDYKIINQNKRIKSFFLHRIIKKPPAVLKKIFRKIAPAQKLRHSIMLKFSNWNIKTGKRDEMSVTLSNQLKVFFADDVKSLAKLINRDLSAWL